jgi:hypothetical protein
MRATLTRDIDQYNVIASPGQATAPSLVIRDANFPKGDQLIRSLLIRYDATMSGTSTPTRVTNGHIFYMNSITLESDKQKAIVDNMDGLSLHKLLSYDQGSPSNNTALSATPADSDTPSCSWEIPLALRAGIRPYDTQLDVLKQSLTLKTTYGAVTNLWTQSSGTPLVVTNTQGVAAKILPGPVVEVTDAAKGLESELPIYARYFGQKQVMVAATESRKQIEIPFGNLIYRRILLEGRVSSTKAELSTVLVGTARVTLEINNVPIVQNVRFRDLQSFNKGRYSLESLFNYSALIDFDADDQERIGDMLKVITKENGSAYLYVDVVYAAATDSVLVSYDALREIDPAAVR